jgi:hypothetical protein
LDYQAVKGVIVGRTSWISQIIRINNRIVHRIGGIDIDSTMAVGVLEGSGDADIAICIAVHEQEFDLADGAVEDCFGGSVIDCFVASYHAGIVGRVWFIGG